MLPGLFIISPRLVVPGSRSFTTPGAGQPFEVPNYNLLTVTLLSPSGGGGPGCGYDNVDDALFWPIFTFTWGVSGTPGTETRFASETPVIATPGQGGSPGYSGGPLAPGDSCHWYDGGGGAHGSGSGGTVTQYAVYPGVPGSGPYGWHSSIRDVWGGSTGGWGGYGARVVQSWNIGDAGAPVPGTVVYVTVGQHGNDGYNAAGQGANGGASGGNGTDGSVGVVWS